MFGAEQLEVSRIDDTQEIFLRTPNVSLNSEGSILSYDLGIRGVTNIGGILNSNAIYVDEFNITPLDISATASPELFEIERVEVLRGPQGTLFGRNVAGGAVSITTKRPADEFEASLTGEAGNFGTYFARGMANLPMGESAAFRFTGFVRSTDGWIEDIDPTGGSARNDYQNWGARGAFSFSPSDRLTIDLTATYREVEQGLDSALSTGEVDRNYSLIIAQASDALIFNVLQFDNAIEAQENAGLLPPGTTAFFRAQRPFVNPTTAIAIDGGPGFLPDNDDTVSLDAPVGRDNELFIANASVEYALNDAVSLIGNFGFFDTETFTQEDEDYTSLDYARLEDTESVQAWSAEFRLVSVGDQRLDWTVGALFAEDELTQRRQNELHLFGLIQSVVPNINRNPLVQNLPGGILIPEVDTIAEFEQAFGFPPGALAPTLGLRFSSQNFDRAQEVSSFGLFGDATYELTDRLSVSLGARYSVDDVFNAQTELGGINPFVPGGLIPTTTTEGSEETKSFSGRLAFVYDFTEAVNLYGTVSRGTKPGGLSLSAVGANNSGAFNFALPETFEEEITTNYEVGARGALFNGDLRFSLSAFFLDWENAQVDGSAFTPTFSRFFFTQNIPSAESYGLEFEFTATPADGWQIIGNLGLNETEIGTFTEAVDILGTTQDITGNELPLAPNTSAGLTVQYESGTLFSSDSLGGFTGLLQAEFIHRGSQWRFITDQDPTFPGNQTDSYEVFNLTAGLRSDRLDVIGFVNNVTDELYFTGYRGGPAANGLRVAFEPRTYGVRGTMRF